MSKKRKNKKPSSGKFKMKILQVLLKHGNKPMNHKQIGAALGISNIIDREILVKDLAALALDKKIMQVDRGKYRVDVDTNYVMGRVDMTSSGAAYVISDDSDEDIYISKKKVGHALQGDFVKVLVYPLKKKRGENPEGEIVEITERFKTVFSGIFELASNGKYGFAVTDRRTVGADFYIPKDKMNGAESGQRVVVKMKDWPEKADNPFGEIVEILGNPEETDAEMHAILLEYNLPDDFPIEVEREAEDLETEIHPAEIDKRRDMRDINTFTIDPEDAKDFDDALSVRQLENGHWEIGVHIADVSHYVEPGSLLDRESFIRGTSVYLVDRVVPMLPEVLSNGVCSLRPNEDKLTFSAVFEMDEKAKIHNQWFGKTVTHSNAKYSYAKAQDVIEGKEDEFQDEIRILHKLSRILRKKRMNDGAIAFDRDEVKFKLDENGEPVGTFMNVMKESNHLIEEFMLLCNRKVSEFVSVGKNGKKTENTYVYRVHDDPDPEKVLDLKLFIRQFGYQLDLKDRMTLTRSMNQLLKDIKGKPEENLISTLTIRTMSKAKYSTENNVGHYGLAFKYYSHFTAPIRRYSDIMAHRLLQHYLEGRKSPSAALYEEKCEHCSEKEKVAVDAERDSIKFMQVKYMEQFIGEEFYGLITGVQDFGIFVEIPETHCEGMIRLRNIDKDFFYYDEKNYSVIGRRTGIIYQLGDKVLIKVARADLQNKQLDFELLG